MNAPTDTTLLDDAEQSADDAPEQASPAVNDKGSGQNADKPRLDIGFMALNGQPIAKMSVAIRWSEGELIARTDENGCIPPVEAPPGETLNIAVQRFDGSYKRIGECRMPSSDGVLTAVSPNAVVETTTEKHEGQPGNADERIPKPEQGDLGDLSSVSPAQNPPTEPAPLASGSETTKPASSTATPSRQSTRAEAPAKKPSAKPKESTKAVEPKAKQQADKPPQHISGKEEAKSKLEKGRDENGNPLAIVTQKARDWWNSWRMPTFNLWGTPNAAGQGGTAPATPVKVDTEMVKKVEALLAFAREQTEYDYKATKEGTADVLSSMGNGTFKHANGEKKDWFSLGLCYTYVKVALARCKIVDGMLVGESASGAGPSLIAKGFRDVTAELPDARWAAAGDVIVYAWSDQTWEDRKKKKRNPKWPNHGHIDIRDYQFYISDFIPAPPKYLGHPTWFRERPKDNAGNYPLEGRYYPEYINIRIYRKAFDPLPTQRILAFLRCIREFECQAEHDDGKRYQMLNAPLPGGSMRFSSYKTHPWEGQGRPVKGSTAAGAYQIQYGTWSEVFDKGLIEPKSDRFSPAVQDRIAVIKLEDRRALHLVRTGEIQEALSKLTAEWTSLPGGKENARRLAEGKKPMDMAYFQSLFDKYLDEERKKG